MSVDEGDVFRNVATAGQKLLLQFQFLASAGSGAVLSPATENGGAPSRRTANADAFADMVQFLAQQQREEQIRVLNQQLDDLDRRSDEALRAAQDRLVDILRGANKTKDGRAVFEDEDGTIYDQYGKEVGADEIDWENWKADAWKWGDVLTAQQSIDRLSVIRAEVLQAKDDLGNNPSNKRLDEITDLIAESDSAVAGLRTSGVAEQLNTAGSRPVERSTSAAKLYDDRTAPAVNVASLFGQAVLPPISSPPDRPAEKPVVQFTPD